MGVRYHEGGRGHTHPPTQKWRGGRTEDEEERAAERGDGDDDGALAVQGEDAAQDGGAGIEEGKCQRRLEDMRVGQHAAEEKAGAEP